MLIQNCYKNCILKNIQCWDHIYILIKQTQRFENEILMTHGLKDNESTHGLVIKNKRKS